MPYNPDRHERKARRAQSYQNKYLRQAAHWERLERVARGEGRSGDADEFQEKKWEKLEKSIDAGQRHLREKAKATFSPS